MIRDPDLVKSLSEIVCQLVEPEIASQIEIVLIDNVAYLGWFSVNLKLKKALILVNTKAKEMLLNKEGRKIVYATLAHEGGHIKDCLKNIDFYSKEPEGLSIKSEIAADKEALVLLRKIYNNPKDILLKQIEFNLKEISECKYATKTDKELTSNLAEKRRRALLSS